MKNSIVELRQTGENTWVAKYQGNYGLYTIRVTMNGKKATNFSCSCPSDSYPCKHIFMIEKAIIEEIAVCEKQEQHGGAEVQVEDLIRDVPAEWLRKFIAVQAKYNPELFNAIFLEFIPGQKDEKGGAYHKFLRDALMSIRPDDNNDNYYSETCQTIDVLDDLFDKMQDHVRCDQYDEALLICKACIEEYSRWLDESPDDISHLFYPKYQSIPFEIIESAAMYTDKKELFNYCISEVKKKKYAETDFNRYFHRLLANLAVTVDPEGFIALQDTLLEDIPDKDSYEAKVILKRKIDFFRRIEQEDKAWSLVEENIQIESFRLEVVQQKIKEQKFLEAKKLITDFIGENGEKNSSYTQDTWHKLLLEIAQNEKDIPAVQKLAYGLIEECFKEKYFVIYKAAFSPAEWPAKREALFLRYDAGKKYFNASAADLLKAENDAEHLMSYIEKHFSLQLLEQYYQGFASAYPEKTIALFKNAINPYVENNMGRNHYEYILVLLRKMSEIKGGKEAALSLAADYKARYKSRRAMIETLNRL